MKELILNVVTPVRSIAEKVAVESIVLPGEAGQLTILPGHTNFITTLTHGTFAYKVRDEWNVAFLSGGFAQVFEGEVSVLAETLDMSQELDVAQAEFDVNEFTNKLKTLKVGTPEYANISLEKELAIGKLKAAQKKII